MTPVHASYSPMRAALRASRPGTEPAPRRDQDYLDAARPLLEDGVRLQNAGSHQEAARQYKSAAGILREGAYHFRDQDAGRNMAQWADKYERQAQALVGPPSAAASAATASAATSAATDGDNPVDEIVAAVRSTRQQAPASANAMDEVIGAAEAKDHLLAAIELPTKLPSLFNARRKPWHGILMYGPPGTGKTLLARAAAAQTRAAFYCVDSADIVSKWMGDSERFIKALFAEARANAPAIIFIDEIDALLSRRGDNEHEMMRRVKTMLLTQMDGFVKNDRVVVIGATNRPWDLDDAALRRLQRRVLVPLPSPGERAQLFQSMLTGLPHGLTAQDCADFAERTACCSGADIANIVTEASLAPVLAIYHATHFVTGADGNVHPCDATTPQALPRPADLAELDKLPLHQAVTRADVLAAIEHHPPTTSAASYKQYSSMISQHGATSRPTQE